MKKFYIIYPLGRQKLKAKTRDEAIDEFNNHWTARHRFYSDSTKPHRCRRLVEEVSEEILVVNID